LSHERRHWTKFTAAGKEFSCHIKGFFDSDIHIEVSIRAESAQKCDSSGIFGGRDVFFEKFLLTHLTDGVILNVASLCESTVFGINRAAFV
jgi:hypothetical protein